MSLKGTAQETIRIIENGGFIASSGEVIEFKAEQNNAEQNSKLYRPEDFNKLLPPNLGTEQSGLTIEVTDEKTQAAVYRMVVEENCEDVLLLNFASARNPSGGFLNGAKSQEEDLARCSGLYKCQLTQFEYYEANREEQSLLYTDHLIYSPKVPWFRKTSRKLLNRYFLASIITSPAPNAGQIILKNQHNWAEIEKKLRQRAGHILAAAEDNHHRTLLLGAWGCGVFMNNPVMVADAFGQWLESPRFAGSFDRIVFGIYDRSKRQETLKAFQNRFN